jgi:rubrerythrin
VLITASAIISFYEKQAEKATLFYLDLAENVTNANYKEVFYALAAENEQNQKMVVRAYREAITDAIEAGFAFSDLREKDYIINLDLNDDASFIDRLQRALEFEERALTFCNHVSERSRTLLADISYTFENIAKKTLARLRILRTLLDQQSPG